MIDLGRIGFFKSVKAAPTVAFVAVSKEFGLDQAKAVLAKAEVPLIGEPEEQEEGFLLKTADFKEGTEILAMKVSDGMVIGIATRDGEALQKSFSSYAWESTDFKTVLAQEGAMPMVGLAASALMDTIYNSLDKADDATQASDLISKAIADFSKVVLKTVGNVPAVAFKLEKAHADIVAVAKTEPEDEAEPEDEVEQPAEEPAKVEKTEAEPEAEAAPAVVTKSEPEPEPEADPAKEPVPAVEKKADVTSVDLEPVMAAIQKIADSVEGLKTDIDGKMTALKAEVEVTSKGLKKMDEALGSNLTGGDTEEDRARLSKSDDDEEEEGWLSLDTGFSRPDFK